MEEKNELNDIILNKSGSGAKSKKLLLAIAALTLILIIVLVIMNSLKTESNEQPPHAAIPPEPTAPTEIIDDPLFEPVEVIQEGSNTTAEEDLGKIAQKIKQESFEPQSAPAAATPATVPAKTVQPAPAVKAEPAPAPIAPAKPEPKPAAVTPAKPEPKPAATAPAKPEPKAVATAPAKTEPKPATVVTPPKAATPVVNTPTIKSVKPSEPKPVAEAPKTAPKASETAAKPAEITPKTDTKAAAENGDGVHYIQVGSFTKEPNQALYDRINASGMKYTTKPAGSATKVLVGPFQGKKPANDALGTVRKNIEANAFIVKG